ncbi:MAG: DUF3365 domain-containing protein [Rhodanobacteraceae bacterium]|nr:DUF3365 domain-containing protein [Rhodanobacteraceae bacterium]
MPAPNHRSMLLTTALSLLLAQFAAAASADDRARADAAIQDLGTELRGALVARMQADGPVAAIDFCHDEAPRIAARVGERHGLRIGRTSVRVRSPGNAAQDWQQPVLADFATQVAAGSAPQSLTRVIESDLPAGVALRTMKGIAVEAPCLACHGSELAEPVAKAIAAKYPADAAIGFSAGELRGAFWVEVPQSSSGDVRAVIRLTAPQREELRAQMRQHLESVRAVLAALAAADWDTVATAAAALAPGRGAGQRPAHSFRDALPPGWFNFARPMHQAFGRIQAEAAGERRSAEVIAALAAGTEQCTACHASFRIGVE